MFSTRLENCQKLCKSELVRKDSILHGVIKHICKIIISA